MRKISDEDMNKILTDIRANTTRGGIGLRLIIATGMRQSEMLKIKIDNILVHQGVISFKALKRGSKRMVPVPRDLLSEIVELLSDGSTLGDKLYGKGIAEGTAARLLRRDFERMNIRLFGFVKYSVHSFRHTFAMTLYERTGNDLVLVKKAVGHKSISSTQRYLEGDSEDDAMKAVSDMQRAMAGKTA